MSDMGWKMDDLPAQPTCGYCRDCRWWLREGRGALEAGRCQYVAQSDRKMFGDSYSESVITMADFGCVQWEAKSDDTR